MDTLTFTAPQAALLAALVFLAGVGAATICYTIIRAALTAPFVQPEPEVIVVEAPRRPPALPARQRFATNVGVSPATSNKPAPSLAISPVQWARRAFDDRSRVTLAVQIGAS